MIGLFVRKTNEFNKIQSQNEKLIQKKDKIKLK